MRIWIKEKVHKTLQRSTTKQRSITKYSVIHYNELGIIEDLSKRYKSATINMYDQKTHRNSCRS